MAIFLAAFSLNQEALTDAHSRRIADALSPGGNVKLHVRGAGAVAFVELALWPGASCIVTDGHFAVFGGDPLLCRRDQTYVRNVGIQRLAAGLIAADYEVLANAEGTFVGLLLHREGETMQACTDKLGVRPLYWAKSGTHVYISSAFWALKAMLGAGCQPDWRATTEAAAFGYPLGDRTFLEGVSVLGAGHRLEVDANGVRVEKYWDWETLPAVDLHGASLAQYVEAEFHAAVDRRIGGQSAAMAFLSGGMDSRLIVARLRQRGMRVHSLNFAPTGSQDLVFGRLAADCMGTKHFEFGDSELSFADRQAEALKAWRVANPDPSDQPDRPGLIWSGDGGSVTLGHVYLSTACVAVAREQGLPAAAREMQRANRHAVSPRIFRPAWRHLAELPLQSIQSDLASRPGIERGRNCHLFYMLNDQRRHLAGHFETLHRRRVDLVLPFFDGRFMAAVLASPVDEFLEHRLYNELMLRLPFGAGKVPWQAYPGHIPCPIPIESQLRRQWEDGWFSTGVARRREIALSKTRISQLLRAGQAADVVRRPFAIGIAVLTLLGIGRYRYLVENCAPFLAAVDDSRKRTLPNSPL